MKQTITLYGIPNCDTIKRARAWLVEQECDYAFHDYTKQGVPENQLAVWIERLGWEALVNRKARPGASSGYAAGGGRRWRERPRADACGAERHSPAGGRVERRLGERRFRTGRLAKAPLRGRLPTGLRCPRPQQPACR
jgi:hypothetical protein